MFISFDTLCSILCYILSSIVPYTTMSKLCLGLACSTWSHSCPSSVSENIQIFIFILLQREVYYYVQILMHKIHLVLTNQIIQEIYGLERRFDKGSCEIWGIYTQIDRGGAQLMISLQRTRRSFWYFSSKKFPTCSWCSKHYLKQYTAYNWWHLLPLWNLTVKPKKYFG